MVDVGNDGDVANLFYRFHKNWGGEPEKLAGRDGWHKGILPSTNMPEGDNFANFAADAPVSRVVECALERSAMPSANGQEIS
jgi:hypothetical protein